MGEDGECPKHLAGPLAATRKESSLLRPVGRPAGSQSVTPSPSRSLLLSILRSEVYHNVSRSLLPRFFSLALAGYLLYFFPNGPSTRQSRVPTLRPNLFLTRVFQLLDVAAYSAASRR